MRHTTIPAKMRVPTLAILAMKTRARSTAFRTKTATINIKATRTATAITKRTKATLA